MVGRIGTIGVLAAAAAALCGPAGAATTPIFSTVPVMTITYSPDCTFTFTIDGGITVDTSTAPGTQIPPGPYQLQIRPSPGNGDFAPTGCTTPVFQLTGPDVSYSVSVLAAGFGGVQTTETFQPGATYVAADASHPSQTQKVFTTATTGTSSSLLPPPPPDTSTGGATQADLVGSAIVPFRGTLRAAVGPGTRATLVDGGREVTTLRAGRYRVVVDDASAHDGLFVAKRGKTPVPISGVAFEGTRTVTVDLTAGTWTLSTERGVTRTFAVSG